MSGEFRVGDEVRHILMGWRGAIVLDIRRNEFCSEQWKVKFNASGHLLEQNVYEAEIERVCNDYRDGL